MADHGITDPHWASEIVTTALKTRSSEDLQANETKKQKRLEPFETAFQKTTAIFHEATQTTEREKEVITAQQRLEAATQIHHHWKSELTEINTTLNELENPENLRKSGTASAISNNKEKFCSALTHFEQASSDLKTCEDALNSAYASLAAEETITIPLRNEAIVNATAAEEMLLRNRERASL